MNNSKGSLWRKWDLHIHTPETAKNDQFSGSDAAEKWINYINDINCNGKDIEAVGVTDYFSVENYFKFKNKLEQGDIKSEIKVIFPNVELRITPVTGSSTPINIHCIFNPDIDNEIESRFLSKLKFSYRTSDYSAKRDEVIRLGRAFSGDRRLDDASSYKKGLNQYVVSFEELRKIFHADLDLRKNTIIVVANGSNDGVSGIRNRADYFIGKNLSQLDATRQSIYQLSDAIFSTNEGDRRYFLGLSADSIEEVVRKCGSLKPCFHGCDAHRNVDIFKPADDKFCWIKSDLSFGGLKQAIHEASRRVFIGEIPPAIERVFKNRSKFIDALKINWADGYKGSKGEWFRDVDIPLNPELVAIIGNKGSGKSALADIIALSGNSYQDRQKYSFLKDKKFDSSYSRNFQATILWFSEDVSHVSTMDQEFSPEKTEGVKYLPQSHFEDICNEIDSSDKFRREIAKVVFQHVPDFERAGYDSFDELVRAKESAAKSEIDTLKNEMSAIIDDLVVLDEKSHSSFRNKIKSSIDEKQTALRSHLDNPPEEVPKPKDAEEANPVSKKLTERRNQLAKIEARIEATENDLTRLNRLIIEIDAQIEIFENLNRQINKAKSQSKLLLEEWGIDVESVLRTEFNSGELKEYKRQKTEEIQRFRAELKVAEIKLLDNGRIHYKDDDWDEADLLLQAPLIVQRDFILLMISDLEKQLSDTQRKFEEYQEKRKNWEKRRDEIQGKADGSEPDTLKHFEKVLNYLDNDLMGEISAKRQQLIEKSTAILGEKIRIKRVYDSIKASIETELAREREALAKYPISIESSLRIKPNFSEKILTFVNKNRSGTFFHLKDGGEPIQALLKDRDIGEAEDLKGFLGDVLNRIDTDHRPDFQGVQRSVVDQVSDLDGFYKSLFSLDYLEVKYDLKHGAKSLEALSPGERGALLLVFYLMLDKSETPLIIDQPEDNLDNQSVAEILVPFIQKAKQRRQIIMVTHNPNLAVVADAEQIIRVDLKKDDGNRFDFKSGAIENPMINKEIVDVLEGRMPAFSNRSVKYLRD